MPCTTILAGRKATYDGSTMIARNEDGDFNPKRMIVVTPDKQPRKYKSKIGHTVIDLPDDPMRYTACPNVDVNDGNWSACGINAANVGMTATETVTTNARVLGADPLVEYKKAKKHGEKDIIGGIGEEDMVTLTLPYIHSAREGVLRLGKLLETYGTYEMNGIAFNDEKEVWWLETIGGHHWIARRVKDEEIVIMPNQFGLDKFDFDDAYGKQKENLCSPDLKEFTEKNNLALDLKGEFNPRLAYGSHDDQDHIYNTPRAWYMGRYFLPNTYKWDGENADFTPESDNIPWSFVPEKKVTVEDIKQILSSFYQGTPYNPHAHGDDARKGIYRPIAVANTNFMALMQIRGYMPEKLKGVEWLSFAANPYNAMIPLYTWVDKLPDYLTKITLDVSTENFYWASRLVGNLADPYYGTSAQIIDRYRNSTAARGRRLLYEYDEKMTEAHKYSLMEEMNAKVCAMVKEETTDVMNKLILNAGKGMVVKFNRSDN